MRLFIVSHCFFLTVLLLVVCDARPTDVIEPTKNPSGIVVGDEEVSSLPPFVKVDKPGNFTNSGVPHVVIIVHSDRELSPGERNEVVTRVRKWWQNVVNRVRTATKRVFDFFRRLSSPGSDKPSNETTNYYTTERSPEGDAADDMFSQRRIYRGTRPTMSPRTTSPITVLTTKIAMTETSSGIFVPTDGTSTESMTNPMSSTTPVFESTTNKEKTSTDTTSLPLDPESKKPEDNEVYRPVIVDDS